MKNVLKAVGITTIALTAIGVAVRATCGSKRKYSTGSLFVTEKKNAMLQINKFLNEENRQYVAHEYIPEQNKVFLIHKQR